MNSVTIAFLADIYARYGKGNEIGYIVEAASKVGLPCDVYLRSIEKSEKNSIKTKPVKLSNATLMGNVLYRILSATERFILPSFRSRLYQNVLFDISVAKKISEKKGIFYGVPGMWRTFKAAKKKGLITVLHAAELHPNYNKKMLFDVYKDNKLYPSIWDMAYIKQSLEALKYVDKVICHSDFSRETYLDEGFKKSDVFFVPMAHSVLNECFKERVYSPEGKLRCLFVGNITKVKGVDVILKAFKKLPVENFQLDLCGRIHRDMEDDIREIKNASNITFHNYVLPEPFFEKCDIFVYPSLSDSYAKVVAEAAAFGMVPLVTRMCNAALVVDGLSGLYVKPSCEDLIDKLIFLQKNRDLIQRFGEEAQRRAIPLTWENFGVNTIACLRDML